MKSKVQEKPSDNGKGPILQTQNGSQLLAQFLGPSAHTVGTAMAANQQRTGQILPRENLIIYLTASDNSTRTSCPSSPKPLHTPHPQPSEETLHYNDELKLERALG